MSTEPARGIFEALGDPVRRNILELLGDGDRPVGEVAEALGVRYGISQPATSQHLKVLLDVGLVTVRPAGRQRIYAVDPTGIEAAMAWLQHFTDTFSQPLDALETELVRGRRERRSTRTESGDPGGEQPHRSA
ncbi:helix-turn-helix transcriptional regulator [Microlunatus sp. Gsoil 973]|uniref:ArsR/SmtB family transcription factor n=1 Tax=Microlunatus sp. Gsoil 973 TaxID=2672569 RepID=UPI0012B4F023|nr:metalloregulator ArsR/SmtB family transcription factor [Microlunatus sp. Gsoil 973]QGN34261.1 metalloregulator ArsR/SmtB family transcription factor [Microlunatus sp. Gsoil 973]